MAKEYLKGSIFDRDEWQTHVKTNRITTKERMLGHIIGPGLVYSFYSVVLSLRELFYMDVLRINEVFGSPYTYLIMTIVTMILGIGTTFFINHMTEKTVCRAGRFRPYVLIGTWLMAFSGFFMFWTPFEAGSIPQLVWLYISNILFTALAVPLWNLRGNVISTISRNVLERNNVTTIRSSINVMIAGVVVALGIVGVLYPAVLQRDFSGASWYVTIGVCALFAMGFSFMEYFWTRERITEENQKVLANQSGAATIRVPFLQQFKNIITDKYFLLTVVVLLGVGFYDALQGGNVRVNMITYILGGNEKNGFQFLYLMISMQPMAVGAIVIPNLAKRISARKIMMVSSIITLLGIGICLTNPYNFVTALAGGFVFACGIFAITNMNQTFMQQSADNIEYKYGYRPEGTLAVGIVTTIVTAIMTPVNALYETGLTLSNYHAGSAVQPESVNNWILVAYYGSYIVLAVIIFVVCIFFNMEKRLPEIHRALEERAKKAVEDRGEVYVSPEEQDRLEREKAEQDLEQTRIADLKVFCAKKGLDFETENKKYIDKIAQKREKAEKKHAKKR